MSVRGDIPAGASGRFKPVRSAYEQVADQLMDLIACGELKPGTRLPSEPELARQLSVSRATVREALRLLTAQNLVRTMKGRSGGSFVTLPTVDHISEFMRSSLALLAEAEHVSLDQLLQAREAIEIPAARVAAGRRSAEDIDRITASIPEQLLLLTTEEHFAHNKEFHAAVMDTCGNVLLTIAVQPIFSILRTHLRRSTLDRSYHSEVNRQHREIGRSIFDGDPDAAGSLMKEHLDFMRPAYERAWKQAFSSAHPPRPAHSGPAA